jgi:hypothetical protein
MYGTDLTTPATLELFNNPSIPIKSYSASLVAVRGASRDNFFGAVGNSRRWVSARFASATVCAPISRSPTARPCVKRVIHFWSGNVACCARLRHADEPQECLLIGVDRKWPADSQSGAIDPLRTYRNRKRLKRPRREALRLDYGSPFVAVKGLNPRSARAAHEAAPRCGNRK